MVFHRASRFLRVFCDCKAEVTSAGGDGLSNAVKCLRLELPFAERKSNQQSGVSCTSIEEDQYMTSHANVAQVSPGHAPVHQSSSDELVKVGLRRSGRDTDRNGKLEEVDNFHR